MGPLPAILLAALALASPPAAAQPAAPAAPAVQPAGLDVLKGRWVRPDGGYVIDIRSVGAGGKLEAAYANPNRLPFYTAEASRDGKAIRLYFELRAGGYSGSSYTLTYNAARDTLEGVYYQAVAQQRFDVSFSRVK